MEISVLMCVYQENIHYIRESIESILNQSYKGFEFIIIADDPSCNRVIQVIQEYELSDCRIKLYINKENVGLTKSLNIGLKMCSGEYIVRMDADDIAHPKRIEFQLSFMKRHPEAYACSCYAKIINENGQIITKRKVPVKRGLIDVTRMFFSPLVHPGSMFRRKVNGELLEYDEHFRYSQDFDLWSRLPDGKLLNLPKYLLYYRVTKGQISSKNKSEQSGYLKEIQCRNLSKIGLVLSVEEKVIYDAIFNGQDVESYNNEQILLFLKKLYIHLVTRYNSNDIQYFIANTFVSFLYNYDSTTKQVMNALKGYRNVVAPIPPQSIIYLLYNWVSR